MDVSNIVQSIPKEVQLIFISVKQETKKAAKRFFKKALRSFHVSKPRVITVDKNPAYPTAVEELREEKNIPSGMQIRQKKYLNNIVEQDHRFIKKRVRSMLGLKSFRTATYILSGIEAMHMIKKKQVYQGAKSAQNRKKFIDKLFGIIIRKLAENSYPMFFYKLSLHQNRFQYTSRQYNQLLKKYQMKASMSRKANCWDNACMESFFSHFKSECFHLYTFNTAYEVKFAVQRYFRFYNHQRFQKKLNNLSPYQYRTQAA